MERLNLRKPKLYGERTDREKKFRKKFFIISEGPTEESYFHGVNNFKTELNIRNDIHIEVVEKEEKDTTKSHPKQIVDAALFCMGRIDLDGKNIVESEWEQNCKWDFYDKDIDVVCVIFDRDYRHLEKHWDYIIDKCKANNIFIAMSNPNFEFWLCLHFEQIHMYDRTLLKRNPKNLRGKYFSDKSKSKKYLEIILSDLSGGYKKGKTLDFDKYKDNLEMAITYEKEFEENIDKLFNNLGSNVGVLIKKMKSE